MNKTAQGLSFRHAQSTPQRETRGGGRSSEKSHLWMGTSSKKPDLMLQHKPQNRCQGFAYRWIRPCALSSGSFSDIYCAITRLSLAVVILIAIPAYALAEAGGRVLDDDRESPWHIVADEITYDQEADQYTAKGDVTITKKDRRLAADFVRFDHKTMKALAVGHVIMTAGEDILTGTSMEMDLEAETGTVYDGTIFFKANHFYIKGDKIRKVGKHCYTADKASITTCDGDTPAWKVTGRNLKVTIEGYGFANHAALWAKKIPVLYAPFLVFPVKLKRQSGLLAPQLGYSDRKGSEYNQPFYWAISESSDATFYLHHMGHRGEKLGLEYRYVLGKKSKGTLMYDFLDDRQVDDGTPDSSENWGYEDDNVLRPNSDRYWFRMKNNQAMPLGFSAKLDIDIVSDQDYLHEFKAGYTGFEKTDKYFEKNFGRGLLDEYDDPVRVNSLNLTRNWSKYSLITEARWYDDVINRRQRDTNTILQKLPFAEFNASKQRVLKAPFYFDLDSEYVRFYKQKDKRGHRIDALPRLYLPLKLKSYFTLEPSFGWRQTAWYIDKYQDPSPEKERTLYREIYDIKLDLSSGIYSVYNLGGNGIERIKHTVRPQAIYEFIPDQKQDEYPSFDGLDRIGEKNLITYSLTNTFTSRSTEHTIEKDKRQKDEHDVPSYTYRQFCRLKLEQSYDINKAKENDPEPFSPVYGELQLPTGRYYSMQADATWSQYENDFLSHNVAANIWDKRGDSLFAEHRYKRKSSRSIYYHLLLRISDRLSAYIERERNLFDREDIKYSTGFLYKAQCWSIELSYTDEEEDRRYALMVNLYGLGAFGTEMTGRDMESLFEGEE